MFKLVLQKAEEPEIKLPTSDGSFKKREFQKDIYFCFIDYAKAFDCVDHNELWKIMKEMGIPDHLICLLRNLYAGQEATVRTGHGTTDWFQIRKGLCQCCMVKNPAANVGDMSLIPGLRRHPGEGNGTLSSILGLPWWLRG